MNHRLIDYTADHLQEAAVARPAVDDGITIELVVQPDWLLVRGWCESPSHGARVWLMDKCRWEDIASEKQNPILRVIDGVRLRLSKPVP